MTPFLRVVAALPFFWCSRVCALLGHLVSGYRVVAAVAIVKHPALGYGIRCHPGVRITEAASAEIAFTRAAYELAARLPAEQDGME